MYSVVSSKRHQIIILLITAFAILMDGLDQSVVNVALPVIAGEYGVDISSGSWVVMVYGLFLAGFILAFGKVADNGRIQKIFILGFAIFALGSLVCALSPNFIIMVVSRGIQGLGASMIAATAPLAVTRFLPENQRGFGMGVIATAGGIAFAFGPAIGGLLTAALSWHWIFLINIPIGIGAIFLAKIFIPKPNKAPEKEPFDWLGTFLMFGAIASFILTLERGPAFGWTSPQTLVLGAVFAVLTVLFCIRSLKAEYPLINIRIFKHWKFTSVSLSYLLTCGLFAGVMYMMPYYLENPLGLDAGTTGLLLMISAVITAVIGIPAGSWSDRVGCKLPCILAALCRIAFSSIMIFLIPAWGIAGVIPALIFMGLAFGLSGGPSTTRIVQFSPKGEEGTGTSVMITTDFLGGVIGVAAFSAVFTLAEPASLGISVAELASDIFLNGFHATAVLGLAFAVATLILTAIVPNYIAKCDTDELKNIKKD